MVAKISYHGKVLVTLCGKPSLRTHCEGYETMTREDKIMELAKGMRGRAKSCYRLAIRRVEKGLQYAYRSRKLKKRIARKEWITQVGAGAREHGIVYSQLVQGMRLANIGVDRQGLERLQREVAFVVCRPEEVVDVRRLAHGYHSGSRWLGD